MKSKAPLVMMEQMVMILVFALAAALCLQAFVKSDQMSGRAESRDRAVILCQTAAEAIRFTRGDFVRAAERLDTSQFSEDSFTIYYDGDWRPAEPPARYRLCAGREKPAASGLGTSAVWVRDESAGAEDAELFRIEVSWQEVGAGG